MTWKVKDATKNCRKSGLINSPSDAITSRWAIHLGPSVSHGFHQLESGGERIHFSSSTVHWLLLPTVAVPAEVAVPNQDAHLPLRPVGSAGCRGELSRGVSVPVHRHHERTSAEFIDHTVGSDSILFPPEKDVQSAADSVRCHVHCWSGALRCVGHNP